MNIIDLFEEMEVNNLTLIDALRDFLPLAVRHLKLPGIPKITLEKNIEKSNVPTFGRFTNEDDHVYVAINNRNPNDILRTLAHEMCHFKQRTEHQLSGGSWHTGSPEENQAHDQAGIIMREFNSKFPQYLRMKPIILPNSAPSKDLDENFADGKGPGRPGDSQRYGIPKHATMSELERASHSKGRKGQLARWQLNMRRGHKK